MPESTGDATTPASTSPEASSPGNAFDKLQAKLVKLVNEGVNLKITTVVGPVVACTRSDDRGETVWDVQIQPNESAAAIQTTVNLVDCDVRNVMNDTFITDDKLAKVRDFHNENVATALGRVDRNLQAVQEFYAFLKQEVAAARAEKPDTGE
jgi:hypothetical protein